jgi:hypothetical protein
LLFAATTLAAQPGCLPKPVFVKNSDKEFPIIDLGYVEDSLTLCAYERQLRPNVDKLLGCWTVDPATGVLGRSSAKAIPGKGRRTALDAQSCINNFCITPIPQTRDDAGPFFVTSTNGVHAAILTEHLLYIFATINKAKVTEIELMKPGASDDTNEGNVPWGLLYNGDTLLVIGNTAAPFTDALVFIEDGSRLGKITTDANVLNIFKGGYGILSRDELALADAGLQSMTIVTGANAGQQSTKRIASYAPCTKHQFEQWTEGDDSQVGACRRILDAKYAPYVDMSPVQLPSGDIITTLSGPAQGYIAILNPVDLTEKKRFKLARCH